MDLDFETGACTLDLRKLIYRYVGPLVQEEAASQSPPVFQTPQVQVEGRGQSEATFPVVRLPDQGKAPVEVLVEPAEAAGDVQRIRIYVEDPPWDLRLPRPPQNRLQLPARLQLPLKAKVTAFCTMRSGAPWDLTRAQHDFEVVQEQRIIFSMSPPPARVTEEAIRIKTKDTAGQTGTWTRVVHVPSSGDWLLGVAGAYSLHFASSDPSSPDRKKHQRNLAEALRNLGKLLEESPVLDIDLLQIDLHHPARLPRSAIQQLAVWAEEGAVPLLRWGVPLAIRLLDRAGEEALLLRWLDALRKVERQLSPISVWTAWTE